MKDATTKYEEMGLHGIEFLDVFCSHIMRHYIIVINKYSGIEYLNF